MIKGKKRPNAGTLIYRGVSGVVCLVIVFAFQGAETAAQQRPATTPTANLPESLTPEQALEEAVQYNLSLLAEKVNLTLAEASRITASLRPNPVFSFAGDHLDWLGTGFDETNAGGPPEITSRVDFLIERGGKRRLRMARADFAKEITENRLLDAIRRLKEEVSVTCIGVIQAKAGLALAKDNLRTYEELVKTNSLRVNAGAISPLELTRSQVAMLQFRSNVSRAELALSAAKTRVQNLLGRKVLSDEFDIIGNLTTPLSSETIDFPALQEIALSSRPDLQALETTQARSEAELKLQLAQAKIDYTLGAGYIRQQGVNGQSNSLGFYFSAPLPFNNRNQGEIARAQAEKEQVARQVQALKAQVQTEVKTTFQEFQTARELVKSIERDLLKPAEQARDTSAYVYHSGGSSLIEFLDAQRAFNETMQSYYEAQASYRRALIQLNSTVGKEVIH